MGIWARQAEASLPPPEVQHDNADGEGGLPLTKGPKGDFALQKTWPASYIRGPCVAITAYIIFFL